MPATPTFGLAVAFAAGTFAVTACNGTVGTTAPTPTTTTPSAPPSAAPTSAAAGESSVPAFRTPLPTDDAVATRDELLALAHRADIHDGFPDTAMVTSWLTAYPNLRLTLFADQVAEADTISVSPAFLITEVDAAYDQAWAFAVADRAGRCAAAVAVIPGTDTAVADDAVPTIEFTTLDLVDECSADGAIAQLAAA